MIDVEDVVNFFFLGNLIYATTRFFARIIYASIS